MKLNSNPYVYPYTPFKNLGNKKRKAIYNKSRKISTKDIAPLMKHDDIQSMVLKGASPAEKIFNMFLSKHVLFGPEEYLADNKNYWIDKINHFINMDEPLQMTILGFPFKVPVPIKTNRKTPDLGEALSMSRLHAIAEKIKTVYQPGANITIVAEGAFGKFNKMTKKEINEYYSALKIMVKSFKLNSSINLRELEEMEKLSKNFDSEFKKKVTTLKKLQKNNDEEFSKKYLGARESIYRIINTRDLKIEEDILMDVYNAHLDDQQTENIVKKTRKYMHEETHAMLLNYHAYLLVRDDLNYIEKTIPHAITLSVSPKPNRLGLIPVNKHSIRLPYHGVPVLHKKTGKITIEYLIDLKRMNKVVTPVFWDQDSEQLPFFYEVE